MSRLLSALLVGLACSLPSYSTAADAPPVLLANVFSDKIDVSRYMVSEKLDGVRAIWDGQVLRFRSGRAINSSSGFPALFGVTR